MIKKLVLFISIILLALFIVGCSSEDIYIDDMEDDSPLSIYGHGSFITFEDNISNYNKMVAEEGREIEITRFKVNSIDDFNAMYTQILKEMSLGGGPDIIAIDSSTGSFIDINKLTQSNAFADMDILIENSETFDFEDYNKKVLDAGIINDKRVFIPISYKVEYLVGVEESFEYNNLEIPEELTMDTFLDLIEKYHQNTDNPAFYISCVPYYLLSEFIEIGKPIEKSNQLKRLFKVFKEDYKRNNDCKISVDKFYKEFLSNHILFYDPWDANQYWQSHNYYNIINNLHESNMILFDMPINKNNSPKAYTDVGFAININSKHKNEAFEFIEYMLSEGVQTQTQTNRILNLPVNKKAYERKVKDFLDGYCGYINYDYGVEETEIPIEMKNDLIDYVESIESCEYIGNFRYVYRNIINENIKNYYDDRITFDEMIDEINNKLSIYYSE